MITPIMDSLDGRKTYLVAGATVVFACLGLYLGELDAAKFGELLLAAAALAGLRHGIEKAEWATNDCEME